MHKKRHLKVLGKRSIIYISVILSLSLMGVGYAVWNDGLIMNISFKTGFTKLAFDLEDDEISVDDGELEFILSEDKNTLSIQGKIYPSFNKDIKIEIIDEGSVPSILANVEKKDSEISDLKDKAKSKYSRMSNIREEYKESFDLNINSSNHSEDQSNTRLSRRSMDESSGLEGQIDRLKDEIRAYDHEEDYDFKYKLLFEQEL